MTCVPGYGVAVSAAVLRDLREGVGSLDASGAQALAVEAGDAALSLLQDE